MKVDMSPKAVPLRLRQVGQLRRLCISLAGPRLRMKQFSGPPPKQDPPKR